MNRINHSLRIKKFLFEMLNNSRITSKKMGKILRSSQQSVSYLKNAYYDNQTIQSGLLIADPVKLGYIDVIVGINFLVFDGKTKQKIFSELNKLNRVISVQESKMGCDILIEYCVRNLSEFNKKYNDFLESNFDLIETHFIFPSIVKHVFSRNYLCPRAQKQDIVVCGDRDLIALSELEKSVLHEFNQEPLQSLVKISKKLKISINSISKIKKKLEDARVIRQYSVVLNIKKTNIIRKVLFLRHFSRKEETMRSFLTFAKQHNNIINLIKLIGHFDLLVTVEMLENYDILTEIRSKFKIKDYLVLDIVDIKKEWYLPNDFDEK